MQRRGSLVFYKKGEKFESKTVKIASGSKLLIRGNVKTTRVNTCVKGSSPARRERRHKQSRTAYLHST